MRDFPGLHGQEAGYDKIIQLLFMEDVHRSLEDVHAVDAASEIDYLHIQYFWRF